jgi:hypothetical protein
MTQGISFVSSPWSSPIAFCKRSKSDASNDFCHQQNLIHQ